MQQEAACRNAARQGAATPADGTGTQTVPPPVTTTPAAQAPATASQPESTSSIPATPSKPPTAPSALPTTAKPASSQPAAQVKSVKFGHDKSGGVIEIVNSRAIAPALQTLDHPPRLVIDIPNANMAVKERFQVAKGDQFTELHVDQFQEAPPVTRVTVDLKEARTYTWDAAGNRLTIRLKPAEDPAAAKAAPPAPPPSPPPFRHSRPRPSLLSYRFPPAGLVLRCLSAAKSAQDHPSPRAPKPPCCTSLAVANCTFAPTALSRSQLPKAGRN